MHGIVYAKAAKFVQSAKINPVLLYGFPPVAILICSMSACHVSNERKQISAQIYDLLFFSRGYTLRDMME